MLYSRYPVSVGDDMMMVAKFFLWTLCVVVNSTCQKCWPSTPSVVRCLEARQMQCVELMLGTEGIKDLWVWSCQTQLKFGGENTDSGAIIGVDLIRDRFGRKCHSRARTLGK